MRRLVIRLTVLWVLGDWMTRPIIVALYVVVLTAVIVSVDFLFFRHHFWERLAANIGIVLVFTAFYFRYLRHL